MSPHDLTPFLLLATALYASPGPATISLAAAGAAAGFRRALPYVAGMIAGFCVTVLLAAAGLGTLLTLYPALAAVFRWASFAFILYLAWRLARAGLPRTGPEGARKLGFGDAFVLNVLNPKAYVAAMALIATFADPGGGALGTALTFLAYLLPLVAATNLLWSLAGALLVRRIEARAAARWVMPTLAALLATSAAWALM